MICLRLVDARKRVALKTHPKTFKTLDACWRALKKLPDWKHGSIRMDGRGGAAFHIWAEAYTAGGVQERWILLEVCTTEAVLGPDGMALPDTEHVVAGRMEWVAVRDDLARDLMEQSLSAAKEAR